MSNDDKPARWTQSLQYNVGGHQVGVMNVFEKDGAVVAQVSVWNPHTREGDDVIVRAGDEVAVGGRRYRIVAVELAREGERARVHASPIQ